MTFDLGLTFHALVSPRSFPFSPSRLSLRASCHTSVVWSAPAPSSCLTGFTTQVSVAPHTHTHTHTTTHTATHRHTHTNPHHTLPHTTTPAPQQTPPPPHTHPHTHTPTLEHALLPVTGHQTHL